MKDRLLKQRDLEILALVKFNQQFKTPNETWKAQYLLKIPEK